MIKLRIEAPWYTYQKKVKALFEGDPQIKVGEIYEPEDGRTDYAFDIEILNHKKYVALDLAMPGVKKFGNVTLGVTLFDEEDAKNDDEAIGLFRTIFEGNPTVKDIREVTDVTGTHHGYIRFQPEVIQFFDDNLSDFNGNWSGLAQDIAREVFDDITGIHFCTADVRENDAVNCQNGNAGEEGS